jgi:phosphoribosylformimino-5-aminoimidazole carboxamide ribotide isomerase
MKFRPCIDLHDGQVKQIIGSTLNDERPEQLRTNFTASHPSSWFAELYRRDDLTGGHIIKLGPVMMRRPWKHLLPGRAACRLAAQ